MNKINLQTSYKVGLLYTIATLIIVLLAPNEHQFKYQFIEGKPWQYDLLTAPYSFPIYKSKARLNTEQDSIRQKVLPAYQIDHQVAQNRLAEWRYDYDNHWKQRLPIDYYNYVDQSLRTYYKAGIIDLNELNTLRGNNHLEITLKNDENIQEKVPITQLFTVKEAYEITTDNLPYNLSRDELKRIDLSKYLTINAIVDSMTYKLMVRDEMQKLSNSIGVIQSGQRIIDRGQIIDSHLFNILNSYKQVYESKSNNKRSNALTGLGYFILIGSLLACIWFYFFIFRPGMLTVKNTVFQLSIIVVITIITEIAVRFQLFNIYIIPYAMIAVLMRIFFDSRSSNFVYLISILIPSFFVPYPQEFIVIQAVAGVATVFSLRNLSSRSKLIRAIFMVFVIYVVLSMGISFIQNSEIQNSYWVHLLYFGINLIILMFSYLLVYIIERIFGYTTHISMVELSDLNKPLLRQLSETAPGTFQHSTQVSILASEAASAIDADAQLVRAGALYHDIGKMNNPSYFTENQGNTNPHDLIDDKESAQVIIQHVTDGVALAKKYKLPNTIIDFIKTHHGEGQTKFFYHRYVNEHPDEEVDPKPFTYPGPNPSTIETGILMLADAVEASSRSLSEYTPEIITNHVDKIVNTIVNEGLLDNTPLTFKNVITIKKVFCDKLSNMYHTRIKYPEMKRKEQE